MWRNVHAMLAAPGWVIAKVWALVGDLVSVPFP